MTKRWSRAHEMGRKVAAQEKRRERRERRRAKRAKRGAAMLDAAVEARAGVAAS